MVVTDSGQFLFSFLHISVWAYVYNTCMYNHDDVTIFYWQTCGGATRKNLFSQTDTKCRSYWMKEQDRNQHRQGLRMTVPVGNATIILFFVFIGFWFAPVFHFSWCMMTQERNALTLFLHQVSLASVTVVSVFSPLLSTVQSVEQIVSRNCFWDKWSDEILCNCWPCILYDSWWLCCDYNDI